MMQLTKNKQTKNKKNKKQTNKQKNNNKKQINKNNKKKKKKNTQKKKQQQQKKTKKQQQQKRINKIHASYTLEGTDLENVESIKYLGITITSDLRWNTHVSNVCTKANRTLGFLRRNLYSCPPEVKEAAYKRLVRPVLDYGSSVWDPTGVVLPQELESVQKRAAILLTCCT